jgi:hypothetical protein
LDCGVKGLVLGGWEDTEPRARGARLVLRDHRPHHLHARVARLFCFVCLGFRVWGLGFGAWG